MLSHESMENLLDNLESELSELVELDVPKDTNHQIGDRKKSLFVQEVKTIEEKSQKKPSPPPVPARRNISRSPLTIQPPTPASRRINALDKIEKNNENEIIQLQSLNSENESFSSESKKISQSSSKHNTVISINEIKKKKKKEPTSSIRVFHEAEKMPDDINETFFVIKHGKWADDNTKSTKETDFIAVDKEEDVEESESVKNLSDEIPSLETKVKKRQEKKNKNLNKKRDSLTTSITTSFTSSSSESLSDEIPQPQKKTKNHMSKNIGQKKSKKLSDDQTRTSNIEESIKETKRMEITSCDKAIAIYIKSTSSIKYRSEIKGLRIKISFYNVDNGKQIGDLIWTKNATYNNDFNNFICHWNEKVKANFDLKRLREIYNNILIFFEVINNENIPVCWAFMKLFTESSANVDKKLKLQLFEYQAAKHSCFSFKFKKEKILSDDVSIFEQWQMPKRKLPSVLNIYLKDINLNSKEIENEDKEDVKVNRIQVLSANENLQRYWRKVPGQACKVPNQIFRKIPLQDKGSLNVQFSHDGNYIAFSEISHNGHILHIHKFPEMTEIFMMLEHSDIIHDMDWSKQKQRNQQYLVTASADFTAIVWKLLEDSYSYSILPHPAFVYASKFLKIDDSEILHVVTACRDNIIRIWRNRGGLESFELCQELKHPKSSQFTFITSLTTKSVDAFYSSSSMGDIIEWTMNDANEYQLNRHFIFDEIRGRIIQSLEINPRGNKIYFRLQDAQNVESSNAIFALGIATGSLIQRFYELSSKSETRLKISPCGTQIYSTNGPSIRYYKMINRNIVASENNENALVINCPLGDRGFISSIDYHPKDFFLACAVYGGNPGCIIIFNFESYNEKDSIEDVKVGSQESILRKSYEFKQIGVYSDIIKRLDEVFLAPLANQPDTSEILKIQEFNQPAEDNTFTVQTNSKRSKTYTVSQGPATFTIQKGGTYEIQKNDGTDDDETTISESFN
ncbi:unnamed protein product [Chironomus riparius]|uniref:Uncharacterized protein n=1 Tax=Chironomus riparius TaxID=315576 RepID=A0A9N9RIT6_9DIPT|nr:unnamed protein product [Chironomus riparius]